MAAKAELESEHKQCRAITLRAIAAEREHRYGEAIDLSVSSLKHLDGSIQYERKYLKVEDSQLPTIGIVLVYAPPLFRRDALESVGEVFAKNRRVAKSSGQDLKAQLDHAFDVMDVSFRAWLELDASELLPTSQMRSNPAIVDTLYRIWEKIGLIAKVSHGLQTKWSFLTRLEEPTHAKCSRCGHVITGKKIDLLEETRCPMCSVANRFVILGPTPRTAI